MHVIGYLVVGTAIFYLVGFIWIKLIDGVIALLVHTWPWWPLVPAAWVAWLVIPAIVTALPEWATAISQASYQLGIAGWVMGIILVGGWTWFSWVAFSASKSSQRRPRVGRHSPASRRPTAQHRCQSC